MPEPSTTLTPHVGLFPGSGIVPSPGAAPLSVKPERPHISFPFRRGSDGNVVMCEEGSEEEIMSCVQVIAHCPIGYRDDRPEFGWAQPDLALMPVDPTPLLHAIRTFEPRATRLVTVEDAQALANAAMGIDNINVNVGVTSADSTGANQAVD